MADTERTKAELLSLFADGQPQGSVLPQDMRDFVITSDVSNTRFSTGLIDGGELTINGDSTKFDIAAGVGMYVDNHTDPLNPVRVKVSWTAFTAETVDNIGVQPATFISLDLSSGSAVIVQQSSLWDENERRALITLGTLIHQSLASIEAVSSFYDFVLDDRQLMRDMAVAIGGVSVFGNVFGPAASDLTMTKTAGQTFSPGINYANSKQSPNFMDDPELASLTFGYMYQNGVGGFTNVPFLTVLDPGFYDDSSGTLQSVGSNNWSVQRIWFFSELNIVILQYGQAVYNTASDAQMSINSEVFVRSPILTNGFRGWIVLKGSATDLSNNGHATFIAADKFGKV